MCDDKQKEKIREAYLSNVRAVMNLLASMPHHERQDTITGYGGVARYARDVARNIVSEAYGNRTVQETLGYGD